MFENFKVFETTFAGRPLVIETGKIAQLANGSCFVRYGDTVVNVAVSHVFYSWVFGFCGKVKIKGPENVKEKYAEMLRNAVTGLE